MTRISSTEALRLKQVWAVRNQGGFRASEIPSALDAVLLGRGLLRSEARGPLNYLYVTAEGQRYV